MCEHDDDAKPLDDFSPAEILEAAAKHLDTLCSSHANDVADQLHEQADLAREREVAAKTEAAEPDPCVKCGETVVAGRMFDEHRNYPINVSIQDAASRDRHTKVTQFSFAPYLEICWGCLHAHVTKAIIRALAELEHWPISWNPGNKVVEDHRDGTIDHERTNIEREKRGLPVPWTPEMAEAELKMGDIE